MYTGAPEARQRGAVLLQARLRRAAVRARTLDDDPDFSTRKAVLVISIFTSNVIADWTDFDDL